MIELPAWLTWNLVRRLLPYIGIALALFALWRWHDGKVDAAFKAGVTTERTAWEKEAARLRAIAASEAQERAAAVLRADTAEAARRAALARKMAPIIEKVTVYEKSDAGRAVCLDDAGRLLAQEAVAAANADIAAAASKRR